ncbi:MAG TPA: hypothetical protein VFC10_11640 [Terriglobia bacterium]|nr:hypothetical protein [Terriglobia bacterium]
MKRVALGLASTGYILTAVFVLLIPEILRHFQDDMMQGLIADGSRDDGGA